MIMNPISHLLVIIVLLSCTITNLFLSKVLLFKTLYTGADAERSAEQVSGLSDPLNNILTLSILLQHYF